MNENYKPSDLMAEKLRFTQYAFDIWLAPTRGQKH